VDHVLTGAYIIYPWYRAVPPEPRISRHSPAVVAFEPGNKRWHSFRNGMERARRVDCAHLHHHGCDGLFSLSPQPQEASELRTAVLAFVWISPSGCGHRGLLRRMLNKNAPVEGGATIQMMNGGH